jgi:hypothetical protein
VPALHFRRALRLDGNRIEGDKARMKMSFAICGISIIG